MTLPLTFQRFILIMMSTIVVAVVAITAWSLLWPMWDDYRIVQAFLRTVASKEYKLIEDELKRLEELHGSDLGLSRLVAALREGDSYTANMIARGFGTIGTNAEGAVPMLIEGLNENDTYCVRCLVALGEIGPLARAAVPRLLELRNTEQNPPIVRLHAAFTLNKIDPETEGRHWQDKELRTSPEPIESSRE